MTTTRKPGDTENEKKKNQHILTSDEHGEQYDPATPDVARLGGVVGLGQHLGRHVGEGAAGALKAALLALVPEDGGQAKVRQLELVGLCQEDVLRLDVPVGDTDRVEVLLQENKLGKIVDCFCFKCCGF